MVNIVCSQHGVSRHQDWTASLNLQARSTLNHWHMGDGAVILNYQFLHSYQG